MLELYKPLVVSKPSWKLGEEFLPSISYLGFLASGKDNDAIRLRESVDIRNRVTIAARTGHYWQAQRQQDECFRRVSASPAYITCLARGRRGQARGQ